MSRHNVEYSWEFFANPPCSPPRDVLVIASLPYVVVSHNLRQCAIALSQLENVLLRVLEPLTS